MLSPQTAIVLIHWYPITQSPLALGRQKSQVKLDESDLRRGSASSLLVVDGC